LLDCSIRIAILFGGLDCDWQSKAKIGFWIWIVNPVLSFQYKSKLSDLSYQEITISWLIMLQKIFKQLIYQKGCNIRDVSWEFHGCIIKLNHLINICCAISFSKNSWILIVLSIHFENWILIVLSIHFENWILIVNHIFVMALDWIKNWIEQLPG